MSQYFPKQFAIFGGNINIINIKILKLTFQIMQQKQMSKIFHTLILQVLH